jgi:hypothetical protein
VENVAQTAAREFIFEGQVDEGMKNTARRNQQSFSSS